MSTYIQNYGFTKTYVKENGRKTKNEIQWVGDYDGRMANINLDINDNGSKEHVSMQLTNNDLLKLLGVQPVEMPLEDRLSNDFLGRPYKPMSKSLMPIALEGNLINRKKTRKHRKHHKKHRHKRRTYKI